MIEMDEASRMTIEYLRGLGYGEAVHWSSHHFPRGQPWTTHWIDIRIADEGALPSMNWVWTIIGEDDRDGTGPDQLWQFVWPYDLDVHCVWDAQDGPVNEWVARRGEPPPECIAAAYEHLPEHFDCSYDVRGGWSVETVAEALSNWATTHAGRPDLRFVWDPEGEPYPAIREAMERARELAEGGPSWDLGDGLRVADGFMDELLAMDPDDRAELMETLRHAHDRVFGDSQDESEGR
jgi:hypothetical protein